ncbi:MAG: glycosyltransferase family 2 protein, partial [Planctomycetota bacterium]|nr:glycosyltransferase family 2 protein [Planctomycetota bacterium]
FATFASLVLGIPIYDTQCGAKLFRADAALQEVVSKRFLTTWIFDVELIARYGRAVKEVSLEDMIYELPLRRWADVAGSKLKPKDFCKAVLELNRVRRIYPRPTRDRAKRSEH